LAQPADPPAGAAPGPVTLGILGAAMALALLPVIGIGVLSSFIIADLTISRAELGLAITSASGASAVTAMALGRFTDRQGARNALITVFLLAAIAIGTIAVAPTFIILLIGAAIAGLAMGTANPATNRLIVETVPKARWGTITGVKQAGEALTIVACGSILPVVALAIGWRWAFGFSAALSVAAIAAVLAVIPVRRRPVAAPTSDGRRRPIDRNIVWLAVYSLVVGLGAGTIATYLPLYAQEALGMSPSAAGLVVATMGVIAVVGRLIWGHYARSAEDLRGRMLLVAVIAVGAVALFWSASLIHRDLLWAGAFAWGVSILSVGALGNLAVLVYSVAEDTGRASGVMLTGFGIGLMVGPPVFGWTVDTTGAYDVGFGLLSVELLTLSLVGVLWGRGPLRTGTDPGTDPATAKRG